MYMDENKLFAENEKELETLIHTLMIYSQHLVIECGSENAPC